ncbi:amidohydrolase family protein [Thermodesulfobacteriota bacterium]
MIIDVHYHLLVEDWLPARWWQAVLNFYVKALKAMGMEMTIEAVKANILDSFWDPEGDQLIAQMDESGIDKTVILPQDFGLAMGEPKVTVEEQNKAYAEVQKKHPDRIIAFAGIDPRRAGAIELMERAINEWGLKGIKLHPGTGYFPDEKELFKFFEKISSLNAPILIHSGMWIGINKTCDPIHFDNILLNLPNLKIIAAHLGRGWQNVLFEMGAHRPNLFTDFCGWQVVSQQHYDIFCQNLRFALNAFGPERVLFGSDGPFYNPAMPNKDFIQVIRDLPKNAPKGIAFSDEEVEAMLGGSAAEIFDM